MSHAGNTPFWKGVLGGWVLASIIAMVAQGVVLGPAWDALTALGFLRGPETTLLALTGWEALLLIAIYIQAEFLEKLAPAKRLNYAKQGLQFGILFSLPFISQYFFYNIPGIIAAVTTVGNALAFVAAAWVFEKIAVPKQFRTYRVARRKRR